MIFVVCKIKNRAKDVANLSKSTSVSPKSLYSDGNEKIPISLYVEFEEKTNLSGILDFRATGATTITK